MKARVKATGEIVEITEDYPDLYAANFDKSYSLNELEFLYVKEKSLPKDEPDYWEKLKHQAAIAAMQGVLSSCKDIHNLSVGMASHLARAFANELIEDLKNEKL